MSADTQPAPAQPQAQQQGMSTGVKVLIGCGVLLIVILICVGIAFALGLAGVFTVSNQIVNTIENTEANDQSAFNSPKSVGEVVKVGDIEWTVTSAKNLGTSIKSKYDYVDDCVATSGTFVQVDFKVKNVGSEKESLLTLNLYDSQQKEYATSSDVYNCVESTFFFETINPGLEKTFTAVYEVPSAASGLKLKVSDLELLTPQVAYINLGL